MKRITDLLGENDLEEKGNEFNVIDDLNRIKKWTVSLIKE